MEKTETSTGEEAHVINDELPHLFKALSKLDTLRLLYRASDGIENSTHAMEELALTQKKYYARLSELVDIGLVRKKDGVYGQTALGRMIYDRFLPAMGKAIDARDELEFIADLEGMEMENGIRKRIEEKLGIPVFTDSKVKLLKDYESLAVEAIDLYDSAEESVILATNYIDVRVIEAFLRAVDRGVTNRAIMGKNRQSSKIQNFRNMLSVTFAKALINYANTEEIKNTVRFSEFPYTFCVVDGHHNIIEISTTLNEKFIVALLIDDRVIGEKLTEFHDTLWKAGEFNSAIELVNHLKSS